MEDSQRNSAHRGEGKTVSIMRTQETMKFISGIGKEKGARKEFIIPKTINKQSLIPIEETNNNPTSQKNNNEVIKITKCLPIKILNVNNLNSPIKGQAG